MLAHIWLYFHIPEIMLQHSKHIWLLKSCYNHILVCIIFFSRIIKKPWVDIPKVTPCSLHAVAFPSIKSDLTNKVLIR